MVTRSKLTAWARALGLGPQAQGLGLGPQNQGSGPGPRAPGPGPQAPSPGPWAQGAGPRPRASSPRPWGDDGQCCHLARIKVLFTVLLTRSVFKGFQHIYVYIYVCIYISTTALCAFGVTGLVKFVLRLLQTDCISGCLFN